jgi:hypothetical protein
MGLVDFFRPKHRHSDVKVRLEAVRALTSDEADILATVAKNDKDAGVRRIAIEKLDRVELLAELARARADPANRDLAGSRAAELWVAARARTTTPGPGRAALAGLIKLADDRALVEVAVRAAAAPVSASARPTRSRTAAPWPSWPSQTNSPEVRSAALARLTDSDALRALAIDTNVKELGLAALDKLDGDDVLEQIAHKAKAKAVRQRARKRLDDKAAAREAARPKESDAVRRKRAEKAQWLRAIEIARRDLRLRQGTSPSSPRPRRRGPSSATPASRASDERFAKRGDAVPHPPGGGGQGRRRAQARRRGSRRERPGSASASAIPTTSTSSTRSTATCWRASRRRSRTTRPAARQKEAAERRRARATLPRPRPTPLAARRGRPSARPSGKSRARRARRSRWPRAWPR